MPSIILASSSAGRKNALRKLGLKFKSIDPNIDESPRDHETVEALVRRLSEEKAKAIHVEDDSIIIAGDQLLTIGQTILAKPKNKADAFQQLTQCSGRTVLSLSGMCVYQPQTGFCNVSVSRATAHYRSLSASCIQRYLDLDKPFSCAGSIRIEDHGFMLLESLKSDDYYATHGLPLLSLITQLEKLDINLMEFLS